MSFFYHYLSKFKFFTMSETTLTVWITILLGCFAILILSLIAWKVSDLWLYRYLTGRSPEDLKTQYVSANIDTIQEICECAVASFGVLVGLTGITFMVANYFFTLGMVLEIFGIVAAFIYLILRSICSCEFHKDLKNGTADY